MLKVLLAGLIGGLAAFGWGAASHMVLHIGDRGVEKLSKESAVMAALSDHVSRPGLYVFPGIEPGTTPTEKQQKQLEERYREGPTGFLVFDPDGRAFMSGPQFAIQAAGDILAAFLAAVLLSMMTRVGYLRRVLFVTVLGVFAWASLDVPAWNWYRFPDEYTLFRLVDGIGRWFCAGLLMAGIVSGKPR